LSAAFDPRSTVPDLDSLRRELAPHGVLRAAINLSNPFLVTGRPVGGAPEGVSPSLAAAIADALDVPVELVGFASPGVIADTADDDRWDIALIGAEPARAERIVFTEPYVEIEASYLVPAGMPVPPIDETDVAGTTIVAYGRSAYGLWLTANIKHARLVLAEDSAAAAQQFADSGEMLLAGLTTALADEMTRFPGSSVIPGRFMTVQQAVGTRIDNAAGAAFLARFVTEARASGLVAGLTERFGVAHALSVPHS
jgi:polar amino acid transport system substrate-binding protein